MTIFPTPEQEAKADKQFSELRIAGLKDRMVLLEELIRKYANHVEACEGVSFLENRYRNMYGGDGFTDEEWVEIRHIARETE